MNHSFDLRLALLVTASTLTMLAANAYAQLPVTTTSFPTFDGAADGIVMGEIGTNVITFETDPGVGFGHFERWDLRTGTDALVTFDSMFGTNPGGVSTAALMGAASMSTLGQTISFSESIQDPTVLIADGVDGITVDFGSLDILVRDSNNVSVTGSVITFPGGVGNNNESLGFTVFGAFGPTTPLTFTITNDTAELEAVAVTVGTTAVPEPATAMMLALSGAILLRRRRVAC